MPACGGERLPFCAKFCFVCYKTQDDAFSASSISSAVQSFGGAGYVISYGGKYYITFACYYGEEQAQSVCAALRDSGLDCEVLKVEVDGYDISEKNSGLAREYCGYLSTLCQLADVLYNTANALDSGAVGQEAAKGIISDAKLSLQGLYKNPALSSFAEEMEYILSEFSEVCAGYVYARDVRALQIALCDSVINADFL